MDMTKEHNERVLKRKKPNIFQRFSHRISKYFHKSKTPLLVKNEDCNLSKSCLADIPYISKSQDDLRNENKFTGKRKKFGISLNLTFKPWALFTRKKRSLKGVSKKNERCLSEGDLTREENRFYSHGSSPLIGVPRPFVSSITDPRRTDITQSFKNELALKLRAKNPTKDTGSVRSKTPDSPIGLNSGTSPSQHVFNEARTPRSMSSLSHSSNSLLSGNATNNYGTSDAESMSRSVIDSSDDIGIVVDMTTPICKTTAASLLDSKAARQKIAASKSRRARPKALIKVNDKVSPNDSERFSPVRDKRDILEEISEEDSVVSRLSSASAHLSTSPAKTVKSENQSPIKTTDSRQSDPSINTVHVSHTAESGDSILNTKFNLRKSKFPLEPEKQSPDKAEPTPRFYVKLRPTGSTKLPISSDNSNTSSEKVSPTKVNPDPSAAPKINRYKPIQTSTIAKPNTADVTQPNVTNKDSTNVTAGYDQKRMSRVLNLVKNFESVPCTDSH